MRRAPPGRTVQTRRVITCEDGTMTTGALDLPDTGRLELDDAKDEVKQLSLKIINDLGGKIHKSATDTLEAIAKSFGARAVKFEFNDEGEQVQLNLQNVA